MAILNIGTGADGDVTITSNKNINTAAISDGRTFGDGIYYQVSSLGYSSAVVSSTPNGLAEGDEVLLINTMGRSGYYENGGNYEFFTIDSVDGTTITFTQPIQKLYGDDGGNANILSHPVMLQRVPNYNNLTINNGANLTCTSMEHAVLSIGGVIALRVKNTLNIINGNIHANSSGGQGGQTYAPAHASGYGRGGGTGSSTNSNDGGGGGYGTAGQTGNYAGGPAYGEADLSKLHCGSGGGRGYYNVAYGNYVGGDGGGVVFVCANIINISTGGIKSNGGNGNYIGPPAYAAGGGGSGGALLIHASLINAPNSAITANKGLKGAASGGDGGYGRVAIYYLDGSIGTVTPTPYTETISMPYKIEGLITGKALSYIRIYDPTTGKLLTTYSSLPEGSYEIDAPGEGPYDIMAKASDGQVLSYGNVIPRET